MMFPTCKIKYCICRTFMSHVCPYITEGKCIQSQNEASFWKSKHPTYFQDIGAQIPGAGFVQWHIECRVAPKNV